jgi:pyruvate dehydrogenase E2 component (dihydrolipoyllysine-residue acetyltransferase)
MAREFKLPDLGEGVHEGEVRAILVAPGDRVTEGNPILAVETDKAAVEIPSPFTGTVQEIRVKAGDMVHVGDVLITFGDAAEKASSETAAPKAAVPEPPTPEAPPQIPEAGEAAHPAPRPSHSGPIPASPATRRLARELGVDLAQVPPTGPSGLVTAEDVRRAAQGAPQATTEAEKAAAPEAAAPAKKLPLQPLPAAPAAPPLPDFSKWGPVTRVPVRSIRRATARQMALSWAQIPHVTSQDTVDITRLETFRQRHREAVSREGGRLTLTVFALKAVATALRRYPHFNASLDVEAGEIIVKEYFHIGVAVDTEEGLIVPVVRDVDRKSLTELAVELDEKVRKTRDRSISLPDLQGGTFTITNVGTLGGGHFSPMINYPQVAILGMGGAQMRPAVVPGEAGEPVVAPRLTLPLVLAIDHRVVDGADAGRFMAVVKEALEDPESLLMMMA